MDITYRYYRVPESDYVRPEKSTLRKTLKLLRPYKRGDKYNFKPHYCGGAVRAVVTTGCGMRVSGWSVCSLVDRFTYKEGRERAYDRAMEQLDDRMMGAPEKPSPF